MNFPSKTKIVCTIGPACNTPPMIEALIHAGMNVARLNFSHGSLADHENNIKNIREISTRLKKTVAIMQDLSGPKIRVGSLAKGVVILKADDPFILTTAVVNGDENIASITYTDLPERVFAGDTIFLCDGEIELKVVSKDPENIYCKVVIGGPLSTSKGINIPGRSLPIPSLTEKDRRDLEFGLEQNVDYIALSFVKNVDDVLELKELISKKGKDTPIIAKIEKHEALNHLEEITKAAAAIMVARGDLGIEIPLEEVPLAQKNIIRTANRYSKPVITATQMLGSMVNHYRPTRAEVSDVANAIYDGTDAVMLSEETAKGCYPIESVRMLTKIARQVEPLLAKRNQSNLRRRQTSPIPTADAISMATCQVANDLGIKTIVTCTQTGSTARYISKYRPGQNILAVTPSLNTCRRLALVWGVIPILVDSIESTDDMMLKSIETARNAGYISKGETLAITGGVPVGEPGSTNLLRVYHNS